MWAAPAVPLGNLTMPMPFSYALPMCEGLSLIFARMTSFESSWIRRPLESSSMESMQFNNPSGVMWSLAVFAAV
jgi:hypothetical protein